MINYEHLNSIFDLIGTIAFALSGATMGVKKKMDIFGVIVLGIVTALGGGLIRDIVLGYIPPAMFRNSTNALISTICSIILFIFYYRKIHFINITWIRHFERLMLISDTIGLGAFTVTGINMALKVGYDKKFLFLFVGVITGIGGGIIRDVLSREIPVVFESEIYAIASLIGAFVYVSFMGVFTQNTLMILSFLTVIIVRLYSVKKNFNLPKIK